MKQKIKFSYVFIVVFFLLTNGSSSQVGIGTNTPDSSAQLDVFSNNKGFLPPRIALTATNLSAPLCSPAAGLLIYNTANAGTFPNNVIPRFYYWKGLAQYPITNKGNIPGEMQYWNGSRWVAIPLGLDNQMLTICGGVPTWGSLSVNKRNTKPRK